MSAGVIVSIVALSLGVLSSLAGAVWWMSALYGVVKGIRSDLHRLYASHQKDIDLLWSGHEDHEERLDNHDVRITKIEA